MVVSAISSADCQVGCRIIEARIDAGVSQCALADILGISLQHVREFEIGLVRPSAMQLFEIAAALQKAPGWFFSDAVS